MRTLADLFSLRRLSPRAIGAVLCTLALAFVVTACNDDESPGPEAGGGGQPQEIPGEAEGELPGEVTLAELLENPSQFIGQRVTVSGAVAQAFVAPGAFTLGASVEGGGEGVGAGGEGSELLVLAQGDAQVPQAEITEGDPVQVTGTICQVTANVEQEGDFLFEEEEADTGFLSDFQDQVAVFATQIDAQIPEEDQGDGGDTGADATAQGTATTQGQGTCPGATGG